MVSHLIFHPAKLLFFVFVAEAELEELDGKEIPEGERLREIAARVALTRASHAPIHLREEDNLRARFGNATRNGIDVGTARCVPRKDAQSFLGARSWYGLILVLPSGTALRLRVLNEVSERHCAVEHRVILGAHFLPEDSTSFRDGDDWQGGTHHTSADACECITVIDFCIGSASPLETRIKEFLEENELPVFGLREGAWPTVEAGRVKLEARNGASFTMTGTMLRAVTAWGTGTRKNS